MDLNAIANGAIQSVNPNIEAFVWINNGYRTEPDGSRVPDHLPGQYIQVQKQALTQGDIRQLDKLNVQGADVAAYISGQWYGVIRKDRKGGDIFEIDGQKWLVVAVLEMWPSWSRVALCLQA